MGNNNNDIWFKEQFTKKVRYWLVEQKYREYTYSSGAPDYDELQGCRFADFQKFGPFKTEKEAKNLGEERNLKRNSILEKLNIVLQETKKDIKENYLELFLGETVGVSYPSIKYMTRKEERPENGESIYIDL